MCEAHAPGGAKLGCCTCGAYAPPPPSQPREALEWRVRHLEVRMDSVEIVASLGDPPPSQPRMSDADVARVTAHVLGIVRHAWDEGCNGERSFRDVLHDQIRAAHQVYALANPSPVQVAERVELADPAKEGAE